MVVVSPEVPPTLYLDETYIQRILMNLLSNALKFTSSGYILLLVECHGSNLVATIKDTGCGIPPSFLPDLFEPFKQAQTRGKQRGTGLGLSIIKQLLHRMEGTIDVDSRHAGSPGVQHGQNGSTFTITVPMSVPDASLLNTFTTPEPLRVAIFENPNNPLCSEGLCTAWRAFDFDPKIVRQYSDLINGGWKYVWADLSVLQNNPTLMNPLAEQNSWPVLVPHEEHEQLQQSRIISVAPFIPILKPMSWHSIEHHVTTAQAPGSKAGPTKEVRFSSNVDIVEEEGKKTVLEQLSLKRGVVLLVEDNPVRSSMRHD